MNNISIGIKGEQIASEFLVKKGYKIIKNNFRTRFGEIDLICQKRGALVFVEVKTLKGAGRPEWRITPAKIKKVKNMAQVYLTQTQLDYTDLRLDAICIKLSSKKSTIRHYQNIGFELNV